VLWSFFGFVLDFKVSCGVLLIILSVGFFFFNSARFKFPRLPVLTVKTARSKESSNF
jgi:hypothetical protein